MTNEAMREKLVNVANLEYIDNTSKRERWLS